MPTVGRSWLEMMVRLKRGQTIDHANAAFRNVQPQIRDAVLPGLAANPAFAARYMTDPLALAPAAAGASRQPARRAARLDPATVLREG